MSMMLETISKTFRILGLLCLVYLINIPLVYATDATDSSTLCQQLHNQLTAVSQDIGRIYKYDAATYGSFSNVLIVYDLPDESITIQKRLREVFDVVQSAQQKLQEAYILVCAKEAKEIKDSEEES